MLGVVTAVSIALAPAGLAATAAPSQTAPSAAAEECTIPTMPDDDFIYVVGCLSNTEDDPASPVPGVEITAYELSDGQLGDQVATTRTAKDGTYSLRLGDAADILGEDFRIKLDDTTLPQGTELTNAKSVTRDSTIQLDQDLTISFLIGPMETSDPWWQTLLNNAYTGVVFGLILALASIGLSLVFGTTGLTNFAHGELVTLGAIIAFVAEGLVSGLPQLAIVVVCALAAIIVGGAFGFAQDVALWRPLRRNGNGLISMMIVSIGLSIMLRYVYQYFYGSSPQNFTSFQIIEGWQVGPLTVSPKDLLIAGVCLVTLVVVALLVQRTRIGKATRAVSDNPSLASASGINVDGVITFVWTLGTALACFAGFLFGFSQSFDYQSGFKLLLLIFAAVVLGGLGNIWGAMAGGLLIGLLVEMSTSVIPAEMKYVGGLGVLIVVLLFRPQGLLGRAERVG